MRGPQPCMARRDFLITLGGEWYRAGLVAEEAAGNVTIPSRLVQKIGQVNSRWPRSWCHGTCLRKFCG
jgi:hypothetical protein